MEESNGNSKTECKTANMDEVIEKLGDVHERLITGINGALGNTAEKLDQTAESFKKTAEFIREKDADSLKSDFKDMVVNYPGQSVAAAAIIGFLFGKVISK